MLDPAVIVALSVGCTGVVISFFALLKKYKVLSSFRWPSPRSSLDLPPTPKTSTTTTSSVSV